MTAGRESDPTIRAHRNRRAVHAPVEIWEDQRLNISARMILPYLLHLADRPGWTVRVSHICGALDVGQKTWRAARKSMEACGYYRAFRTRLAVGTRSMDRNGRRRGGGGTWTWEHWVTDVPGEWGGVTDPRATSTTNNDLHRKPSPPETMDGSSIDGFGIDACEVDLHNPDLLKKSRSKRAAAIPVGNITEPSPTAAPRPRRRTHAETGLVYWLDDEPAEIDRLIAAHGLDAVRGAATAIASQGSDPLPSVVAKHLQVVRRKAAQAEPVAPRQRGRTPEELAEDARKARAEMAAIAAQAGASPAPRHTDTRTLETILAETWGIRS